MISDGQVAGGVNCQIFFSALREPLCHSEWCNLYHSSGSAITLSIAVDSISLSFKWIQLDSSSQANSTNDAIPHAASLKEISSLKSGPFISWYKQDTYKPTLLFRCFDSQPFSSRTFVAAVVSWRSFLSCNRSTGVVNNGPDLFVCSVWGINGPVFGFLPRRMRSHVMQRNVIVSFQRREKRLPVYAFVMYLNQNAKSAVKSRQMQAYHFSARLVQMAVGGLPN